MNQQGISQQHHTSTSSSGGTQVVRQTYQVQQQQQSYQQQYDRQQPVNIQQQYQVQHQQSSHQMGYGQPAESQRIIHDSSFVKSQEFTSKGHLPYQSAQQQPMTQDQPFTINQFHGKQPFQSYSQQTPTRESQPFAYKQNQSFPQQQNQSFPQQQNQSFPQQQNQSFPQQQHQSFPQQQNQSFPEQQNQSFPQQQNQSIPQQQNQSFPQQQHRNFPQQQQRSFPQQQQRSFPQQQQHQSFPDEQVDESYTAQSIEDEFLKNPTKKIQKWPPEQSVEEVPKHQFEHSIKGLISWPPAQETDDTNEIQFQPKPLGQINVGMDSKPVENQQHLRNYAQLPQTHAPQPSQTNAPYNSQPPEPQLSKPKPVASQLSQQKQVSSQFSQQNQVASQLSQQNQVTSQLSQHKQIASQLSQQTQVASQLSQQKQTLPQSSGQLQKQVVHGKQQVIPDGTSPSVGGFDQGTISDTGGMFEPVSNNRQLNRFGQVPSKVPVKEVGNLSNDPQSTGSKHGSNTTKESKLGQDRNIHLGSGSSQVSNRPQNIVPSQEQHTSYATAVLANSPQSQQLPEGLQVCEPLTLPRGNIHDQASLFEKPHSYDPSNCDLIRPYGDGNLPEWPPKSAPSQPAFKLTTPIKKKGDEVWPPKDAFLDEPSSDVREFSRPTKSNKTYDSFFAGNMIPNNYPGYRAPPGTQHVGYMDDAQPL